MSTIKLHDKYFNPYLTKEKINGIVETLVQQVLEDCKEETQSL